MSIFNEIEDYGSKFLHKLEDKSLYHVLVMNRFSISELSRSMFLKDIIK